ncbi:MAG: nitroreductase family protein [Candidatus Thorarchaeota archaeon]|nr:nitroreductase family protein [Candidatus Thorarchaeota archaeon]
MQLLSEIRNRQSVIVFQERDVEQEKIDLLIEAARWAPSCFNKQEWNYVLVSKKDETRASFEDALSFGNGWAKSAPYLVAVSANPEQACKINNIPYYAYDLGLSVMSLVIEAEHQGLRVHQMAGYDEKRVKAALNIPASQRVVVIFALGYEGDVEKMKDKITEKIKKKITKARTRKDPQENFFFGKVHGLVA